MGRLVFNSDRIRAILFGPLLADNLRFVSSLAETPLNSVPESFFHITGDDVILEGNHGAVFALAGTTATNSSNEAFTYPTITYNAGDLESIPVGPGAGTKDVLLTATGGVSRLEEDGSTEVIINPAQPSLRSSKAMETEDKIITYNPRFVFIAPYITIWDKTTSTVDTTTTVPVPAGATVLGLDNFGGLIGVVHTQGITMFDSSGRRAEARDVTATFLEGDTQAGAGAVFNSGANAISPVLAITDYLGTSLFRNDNFFSGHPIDIQAFSRDGTIIYGTDPDANSRKVTASWTGDAQTNEVLETFTPDALWFQDDGSTLAYSKKAITVDRTPRNEYRFYDVRFTANGIVRTFLDNGGALTPNTDNRVFTHLINTDNYIYGSDAIGTLTKFNKITREFETETDFLANGNVLFRMENVLAHAETEGTTTHMRIYDFDLNRQAHLDFEYTPPAGVSHAVTKYDFYSSGYFFIADSTTGDYKVFRHDYSPTASADTPQSFTHDMDYTKVERTDEPTNPSSARTVTGETLHAYYNIDAETGALEIRALSELIPSPAQLPIVGFDSVVISRGVRQIAPRISDITNRVRAFLDNTGSGLENKAVGYAANSDTTTFYYVPNNTGLRITSSDGYYSVTVSTDSNTTNVGRICLETDDYIWFVHSQYIGTAPNYTSASHRLGRIKKSDRTSEFFTNFSTSTTEAIVGLELLGDDHIGVFSSNKAYVYAKEDGDRETELDITLSTTIPSSSLVYSGIAVNNDGNGSLTFTNHEGKSVTARFPGIIINSADDIYTLSSDRTRLYFGRANQGSAADASYHPIKFFKTPTYPSAQLAGTTITASDSQGVTFADNYTPVGPALNAKGMILTSTAGVRRLNEDNTITQLTTFVNALSNRFDKVLETETDIYGYTESTTTLVRVRKSTGAILYTNSSVTLPEAVSQNRPQTTTVIGMDRFGPGNLVGIIHSEGITLFNDDCTVNDTYGTTTEFGTFTRQRYSARRAGAGVVIENEGGAFQYRDYANNIIVTADQSIGTQGGATDLIYSSDGTQMLTHDGTNWFKWTITWT